MYNICNIAALFKQYPTNTKGRRSFRRCELEMLWWIWHLNWAIFFRIVLNILRMKLLECFQVEVFFRYIYMYDNIHTMYILQYFYDIYMYYTIYYVFNIYIIYTTTT